MPVLAGWLTGEQVPREVIEQALTSMSEVLAQHGGQAARTVQPGAGLIAFSDSSYAMQHNDEPPVLDWVPERRTLVYRRPLSGLHALYYIENWPAQGNLLFASEVKALLAAGVPRRLHLAALEVLLRYGFIPAPWTAFKDIQVVPAGSILRWQRAKTVLNQSTDYGLDESTGELASLEHIFSCIDTAVSELLPPHEQLVALTGGGSASALATILAAQHSTTPFTVATIGYKNKRSKAWRTVHSIAERCQLPALEISGVDQPEFWIATLSGLEAPCVDTRSLVLHQLLHTAAVETGARVAISGLGAGTLFGSAPSHKRELVSPGLQATEVLQRYWRAISRPLTQKALQLWSADTMNTLLTAEPWDETLHARKLARHVAQLTRLQQRFYYLDLHLRLPDLSVQPAQQLAIQERMAIRSPYLNRRTMELVTCLPEIIEHDQPKYQLPSVLAQRLLPGNVNTQARLSLTAPVTSLLHNKHSEIVQQTLSPEAIKATGIFAPQAVESLLKEQEGAVAIRELLLVFTTQLFCHLFGIHT